MSTISTIVDKFGVVVGVKPAWHQLDGKLEIDLRIGDTLIRLDEVPPETHQALAASLAMTAADATALKLADYCRPSGEYGRAIVDGVELVVYGSYSAGTPGWFNPLTGMGDSGAPEDFDIEAVYPVDGAVDILPLLSAKTKLQIIEQMVERARDAAAASRDDDGLEDAA